MLFTKSSHVAVAERLTSLRSHDSDWFKALRDLEQETSRGVLDPKLTEFVQLIMNASVTGFDAVQIRVRIRRLLEIGATQEEIWAVLKLCTVIGIHAMAVASPIFEQSLDQIGQSIKSSASWTPMTDSLHKNNNFNQAWLAIEQWDPEWLDRFLAVGLDPGIERVLGKRTFELLCIAIDAAVTHLYCPGTQRHIDAALAIGVPPAEILEVLKVVSVQGLRSVEIGIEILEEECQNRTIIRTG